MFCLQLLFADISFTIIKVIEKISLVLCFYYILFYNLFFINREIQGKETAVLELKKDSNELKLIEKDKQDLEERLLNKNKHCEEMEIVISNLKSNLCKVEENNYK